MPRSPATSPTWRLEGQSVTVHIPMRLQRRGGRKLIVGPKGSEAGAPTVPQPNNSLIRALARAHRWQRLLDTGVYGTVSDLAKAEKVNDSYVCRILRLNLLAPSIVEAILDGQQPKSLQLQHLMTVLPFEWLDQAKSLGFSKQRNSKVNSANAGFTGRGLS